MNLLWGFTKMEFRTAAMYRLEFWMRFSGNLVKMYGAYWLWSTLYAQQPGSFPVALEQMLAYGILAMTLDSVLSETGEVNWYIAHQIRTGALQMDLLRSLDFLVHMLVRNTGRVLYSVLTLGLPGFVVGAMFLGLRPPDSLADGLLFMLSLAPAFLISFALSFLLGMVSVYTIEAREIQWVYFSTIQFLSGQFIPLWVFPDALQQVVRLLPFQGIIGIPASIYIGQFTLAETWHALILQVFWAAVLLGICRLVWRKAHTKLTVQGG